jgi:hypothetical protein
MFSFWNAVVSIQGRQKFTCDDAEIVPSREKKFSLRKIRVINIEEVQKLISIADFEVRKFGS